MQGLEVLFWATRFKYIIIQKIIKIPRVGVYVCMYDRRRHHHHHHHHHYHHHQWHYNPQLPSDKRRTLLLAAIHHLWIPNFLRPSTTPSIHRSLGLPTLLHPSSLKSMILLGTSLLPTL
jgi:hypothetical protein